MEQVGPNSDRCVSCPASCKMPAQVRQVLLLQRVHLRRRTVPYSPEAGAGTFEANPRPGEIATVSVASGEKWMQLGCIFSLNILAGKVDSETNIQQPVAVHQHLAVTRKQNLQGTATSDAIVRDVCSDIPSL